MRYPQTITTTLAQVLRIDRAVRLVWDGAPVWTAINIALIIVRGALPLLALFLVKRIVDAVADGVQAIDKAAAFQEALLLIVVAAGVALLVAVCDSLAGVVGEAQSQTVTDYVADVLHAQSVAVDLGYYEDAEYYDLLQRAQAEAPYRPTAIVNSLVGIARNAISFVAVGSLLFLFNPLVALVIFAAALPTALVRLIYARAAFRFEQEHAEAERRASYFHLMLVASGHAKEVRLLDLGGLFREWFRVLRRELRSGRLVLARDRAIRDLIAQSIAAVALFFSFAVIVQQAIVGAISLGDLTMYYLAFQAGLGFLSATLQGLAGVYENNLFLANFYQFLDLEPTVCSPEHPVPVPKPLREGIICRDVSFTYPKRTRPALDRINLRLAPGQIIALVGENGSGKTTLVKLLSRLYDPSSGAITVDGVDLRDLDLTEWRRMLSVVFQDYVHYHLTVRENIWLGDVQLDPLDDRVAAAAHLAGADTLLSRLPGGLDSILGRFFKGGQQISVGEWQKLALARWILRRALIVILDEPTSALDPLAEAELFERFRGLVQDRSAVLVSHRFSTVKMADYVYVFREGRVVEQGSHSSLLAQRGYYARLYNAQAERYQDGVESPDGHPFPDTAGTLP